MDVDQMDVDQTDVDQMDPDQMDLVWDDRACVLDAAGCDFCPCRHRPFHA